MSLSVHVFVYCLMCPLKAFLIEDRQFLKDQYDSKNVSSVSTFHVYTQFCQFYFIKLKLIQDKCPIS